MEKIKEEKGITLIEVLASITLLSIVMLSIFSMLPQMGMMNKHNEDKAQAVNLAKEVLIDWQEAAEVKAFIVSTTPESGFTPVDVNSKVAHTNFTFNNPDGYYHFDSTKGQYNVHIKIKRSPSKSSLNSQVNQIIVQLLNERGNIVSETYGYVKR